MRPSWKLLTVAALILSGVAVAADKPEPVGADVPTYDLKIKTFPAVGKSVTEKSTEKGANTYKFFDASGQVRVDDKVKETKERTFTTTVLVAGDKRPRKYKVAYEKATDTKAGKATPRSYEGKTLIYEQKDGKYVITVEGGGDLDAKELEELTEKANRPDETELLLPRKPVKVGDRWAIDLKELSRTVSKAPEFDLGTSKGTLTLLKVIERNNARIGVLEIKLWMVTKATPMFPSMTIEMDGTLETAIDGSSTAGKMVTTTRLAAKGPIGDLTLDLNGTTTKEAETTAEK